ncbi:hypothetical protein BJ165DRAFT_1567357 [Panaeolus papilionaceus]|nr:hypothetical protein BJ165DRAFT_1567357 [Panaeolus papilionaceus]
MTSTHPQQSPPVRRNLNQTRNRLIRVGSWTNERTFPTIPEPLESLELPPPLLFLPNLIRSDALACNVSDTGRLSVISEVSEDETDEASSVLGAISNCNTISGFNTSFDDQSFTSIYSTASAGHENASIDGFTHRDLLAPPLNSIELTGQLWQPITHLGTGASVSDKRGRWRKRVMIFFKRNYRKIIGHRGSD